MEEKKKEKNHKKHLIKAYLDDSEYEKFISIAKATKRSNSRVVRDMLDNMAPWLHHLPFSSHSLNFRLNFNLRKPV